MKLITLGSSSKGNGYILQDSDGNQLVLECGIKFSEVQKVLLHDISNIAAALVTHEHLDHSKYVKQFLDYGIDVYANKEVFSRHKIDHHRAKLAKPYNLHKIGPYEVYPFEVVHDVPTFGFMIRHPEMGIAVFATDTYYFKFTFHNVNHWIVEANYDKEIMDERAMEGVENTMLRNRIIRSHMSIENLRKMLEANDLSQAKNIVLTHLSDRNSNELGFIDSLQKRFGIPVTPAIPGQEINLRKVPF